MLSFPNTLPYFAKMLIGFQNIYWRMWKNIYPCKFSIESLSKANKNPEAKTIVLIQWISSDQIDFPYKGLAKLKFNIKDQVLFLLIMGLYPSIIVSPFTIKKCYFRYSWNVKSQDRNSSLFCILSLQRRHLSNLNSILFPCAKVEWISNW